MNLEYKEKKYEVIFMFYFYSGVLIVFGMKNMDGTW